MSAGVAMRRAAIVLVAVVAVDQITKTLVRHDMHVGETRRLLGSVVKLESIRNHGVAFSALSHGGVIVPVVIGFAIVALLFYFATHATARWTWLAVGLLLGGAIGNATDRIRAGSVTDFIKFPHWPAFNVADAAITIGVIVLVLALESNEEPADRDEPAERLA